MTRSRREAGRLERHVAHRVERVGDDDEDRVRGDGGGAADDAAHDPRVLGQQVVAAHARLARQAGGDHDDVGAGGVGVVVGAHDLQSWPITGGGFRQVERLALRQPLDDVDEDDVRQPGLRDALRGGRADVAGADDGDLGMGHGSGVSFERMVWAAAGGMQGRAAWNRSGADCTRGGVRRVGGRAAGGVARRGVPGRRTGEPARRWAVGPAPIAAGTTPAVADRVPGPRLRAAPGTGVAASLARRPPPGGRRVPGSTLGPVVDPRGARSRRALARPSRSGSCPVRAPCSGASPRRRGLRGGPPGSRAHSATADRVG